MRGYCSSRCSSRRDLSECWRVGARQVTKVDYQGVADGGATYCIQAPTLDGEVETVRERLRITKPKEEVEVMVEVS